MNKIFAIGALVLGFLGASVLGADAPATGTVLAIKGRGNTTVSMAAARSFVTVAWGAATEEGATDLYAAVSRDGGRTFGAPARVNDVTADVRLSGEQPPRVSLVPRAGQDPSIVVVWTTKSASGTLLKAARSDDAGKSFARSSVVPGSEAAGNRGWESTTVDRNGHVIAMWLDHRELAADGGGMAGMQHDHAAQPAGAPSKAEAPAKTEAAPKVSEPPKKDGVARAQLSKLYVAGLDGALAPRAIAAGVCYCCKTSLTTGPDGAIYAAWRHVYPGSLRDMAFTVSRDGGQTFAAPIRVSEDHWAIEGCPEDGPSLAIDARNRVHVVWPTLSGESLALYYAVSDDGRRFTPRQLIPTEGTPHHPQMALAADGSPRVVWEEAINNTRRVVEAAGVVDATAVRWTRSVVSGAERGVYPAVARTDEGVVVAWSSGLGAASVVKVAKVR